MKDFIIYGTRLKPATLPDIPQNDIIYLLEAVISQPVTGGSCRSDALCHHPRGPSRTVNSLRRGANYSPAKSCAGPTFASLHGTEKDFLDSLGDEREPFLRRRLTTAEVHWWCPALSALQVPWQVSRALTPEDGVFLWDFTLSANSNKSYLLIQALPEEQKAKLCLCLQDRFQFLWWSYCSCNILQYLRFFCQMFVIHMFFSQNGFSNYLVSFSFAWFYRHFPVSRLL